MCGGSCVVGPVWCGVCGVACVVCVGACGCGGRVYLGVSGVLGPCGKRKYRSPLYYPDTLVNPDTCLGPNS